MTVGVTVRKFCSFNNNKKCSLMIVEVTFRKHITIISILCLSSLQPILILDKPTKYFIENFKNLNSILKEHSQTLK